jgi:hypothetical protein
MRESIVDSHGIFFLLSILYLEANNFLKFYHFIYILNEN